MTEISENWTFIGENELFFWKKLVNRASEIRQIPTHDISPSLRPIWSRVVLPRFDLAKIQPKKKRNFEPTLS